MMGKLQHVALSVSALFLSSCASTFEASYRAPDKLKIDAAGDALAITGDQRAIFVRPKPGEQLRPSSKPGVPDGGATVLCAEPAPDVALSSLREISAKLAAAAEALGDAGKPSVTVEYLDKISVTASALAGRTSTVLLTRELLYRMCELSANYRPGSSEFESASANLGKAIDAVILLAKADKADADANKILVKARVDTLSEKAFGESQLRAGAKSKKIDLIVAKSSEGEKVVAKKVDELIAKADKEADKISAAGQQMLKTGAASGDIRDFRDTLIDLSTADLDALWKVAQK